MKRVYLSEDPDVLQKKSFNFSLVIDQSPDLRLSDSLFDETPVTRSAPLREIKAQPNTKISLFKSTAPTKRKKESGTKNQKKPKITVTIM